MYKSRDDVGDPEKSYEQTSLCGPTVIEYLETFKVLFSKYCYWHCRLCLL